MRISVIGAGPGGLAVARGLLGHGHDVRVFERAPGLRSGGSAVTLWPNGAAVLAALGVSLEDLGPPIDVLDGRTDQGRPLLRMHTTRLGARFGTPTLSVPRRRLVHRLSSALPADTITFHKTCTSVDAATGRVTFSDGTTTEADVVVGADGHGSTVRRALRPEAATRPTGWVTWQGLSAVPIDVTDSSTILTMLGRAGFCGFQPAGGGLLQWYFSIPPGPGRSAGAGAGPVSTTAAPLAVLKERFAGWAPPVPDVLAAVAETDVTPWVHHTQPVPEVWGAGRATVLGDAAHTMPPSLAQGVNQALEDAHALTRTLSGAGVAEDPTPLLRRHESTRAKQVGRIAAMAGSESSTTYRPATQLLMRALPDRLSAVTYARLIERSSSVLTDRSPRAR